MNEQIPIFLCCDDKYAIHASATISSVVFNTSSPIHFYILCEKLSQRHKENITSSAKNHTVSFVEVDGKAFEKFDVKLEHLSIAACYRYMIPSIAKNLSKVIYLDCDVIVREDIKNYFNHDISEYYAGVVQDVIKKKYLKKLCLEKYFNSGVMLMNISKMNDSSITEELFSKTFQLSGKVKFLDQDVLNIVLRDKCLFLDLPWSVPSPVFRKSIKQKNINEAIYSPKILHFTGPDKPWKIPFGITAHPYTPEYFFYLNKTPYSYKEKSIKENFKPFKNLINYSIRHFGFFLRPHFWKMRMLYLKIVHKMKNHS